MTATLPAAAVAPGSPPASGPDRLIRILAGVLLVVVLGIIALIVGWPSPPAGLSQQHLAGFLERAHRTGLPHWISFDLVEGLSNVVMFVPLAFLGALALPRRPWMVLPGCFLLSCAIEAGQTLLLPGRYGSWEDVAHNTVGAAVGLILAVPWLLARSDRRRRARLGRRAAGLRW